MDTSPPNLDVDPAEHSPEPLSLSLPDEAIVQHGVLDANIEFIQKPFTWFGLTRKVRDVLNREG